MKTIKKKILKVEMDNGGPAFFSDAVTVSHNPKKFVIDFQQMTPRFSKFGPGEPDHKMVLSHNTIIMDPEVVKDFSNILSSNIKGYEKKFGKLEVKRLKPQVKKDEKIEYTGYIG